MWKLWKNSFLIILFLWMMVGCSTYSFDENAVSGSYGDQAAQSTTVREFAIMVNAEVTVDASTGKANVLMGNPEENTRLCKITLFLDDTGERLYSTPILNPGERVAYAQLDEEAVKQMKEGEYQATAFIDILDEKTQETIGTIEAGVKLTLKNS